MSEDIKKEASVVSGIKGHHAGAGWPVDSKKKKKSNPSKPYGESELFERVVLKAHLDNKSIEEVVRKRGNQWIMYDDDTEAQIGAYADREAAWERQRRLRKSKAVQKKAKKAEAERQIRALTPTLAKGAEKAPGPRKAGKPKPERQKPKEKPRIAKKPMRVSASKKYKAENKIEFIKSIIKENMISYVFENTPVSDESLVWEKFVSTLSKETVMSDPKFKKILQGMAKSEAGLLGKAVDVVKNILGSAGSFDVEKKNVDQDPKTGDVKLNFVVKLKESNVKLMFSVKIENGRPLLVFPDQSRQALAELGTDESKLLRAELMHAQETALDLMDDVVVVAKKRDVYLKNLENKLDKLLNSVNPLELAMLKYLLKNKYKGIK